MSLTVGMACADDYEGVYFTVMALRMYHPEVHEILIVDNSPETEDGAMTRQFIESWVHNGRYVPYTEKRSTAVREQVFRQAAGDFVLCLDCHVMLMPGSIERLQNYFAAHPNSSDMIVGPMLHDDLGSPCTHMEPVWRHGMLGIWGNDPRGQDPTSAESFEVPMQGLGCFAARKDAWPGFNPMFQGFGCEEWYIAEKYRRAGGRVLCLPFLRWIHRFNKPGPSGTKATAEDKVWNYLVGHLEFGMDIQPIIDHFGEFHPPREKWEALAIHTAAHLAAIANSTSARGASPTPGGRKEHFVLELSPECPYLAGVEGGS